MCDTSALRNLAQVLLCDKQFVEEYRDRAPAYGLNRRNRINNALTRFGFTTDINIREQLRRYFDALFDLPAAQYKTEAADLTDEPTYFFEDGSHGFPSRFRQRDYNTAVRIVGGHIVDAATYAPNPINPKETTVKNSLPTPITVTTQVLINGVLASNYSDPELFQSIAAQEAAIKELEGIQTKPASLVDEIDARKAGISALVTYLDSRPKK